MVGCWAQYICDLCKRRGYLAELGAAVVEKYWTRTKKADLQTKLKLYPLSPRILYNELWKWATQEEVPNPDLIAFCAHWILLERCATTPTVAKHCGALFEMRRKWLIEQLVELPDITGLLAIAQEHFGRGPAEIPEFPPTVRFCELCPLEIARRETVCAISRHDAFRLLRDEELRKQLGVAKGHSFHRLLEECFDPTFSQNPRFSYCLATTFLRGIELSEWDRGDFFASAKAFLAEFAARQSSSDDLTGKENVPLPDPKRGKTEIPSSREIPSPDVKLMLEIIEPLFAQHDGIVAYRAFQQQLQAKGQWGSPKRFYALMAQVGAKKITVAIQKRGTPSRRVKAATYYVSPAYHAIDTPLELYGVLHNFIMKNVKNFVNVTCSVKDVARLDKNTGRLVISDLKIQFKSRTTYVEYTSGGREAMRQALQKIQASPRRHEMVLLVGLEKPPRRRQSGVWVKSNRQEALEIAADLGVQIRSFTLTNLEELETYCMTGKVAYTQR